MHDGDFGNILLVKGSDIHLKADVDVIVVVLGVTVVVVEVVSSCLSSSYLDLFLFLIPLTVNQVCRQYCSLTKTPHP